MLNGTYERDSEDNKTIIIKIDKLKENKKFIFKDSVDDTYSFGFQIEILYDGKILLFFVLMCFFGLLTIILIILLIICYRKKKYNIKNIQNFNNKIIGEMMRENLIN